MAKSKIVINFTSVPSENEVISIANSLSAINLLETFKEYRIANYQTELPFLVIDQYGIYPDYWDSYISDKYKTALDLDYNNSGLYTITSTQGFTGSGEGEVTIEAIQPNVVFSIITNTSLAEITITNEVETPPFSIDTVTFSQSTNPIYSKYIKVNVETNVLATSVSSPLVISPNADNPFSFDYARGVDITITCTDGINTASKLVSLPPQLRSEFVNISVFNTPTGATVTANYTGGSGLVLQWSLDDITYQTSNVFNGLALGTYTIYIKDQYGGTATASFSVSIFSPDTSVTTAYSYLSKEMSIRFKKDVVWNNCSIYRNEENTLSCEEKVENAYPHYHLFQTCDSITTQFLSNYETISANVINENGTKDALTIVKRSTNIGATDKRDGSYINLTEGKTGVYYTVGKTYNYTTGIESGTYELYGNVPEYGVIGNYIFLDGIGWFKIQDIVYNDDVNADVLVINHTYEGIPAEIVVSCVYNRENYDVYEFTTYMSDYEDKEIQIEILQSDFDFGTSNYLSEKIKVADVWYDTIELIWYNNTDTFTYYSTGLKNKARIYFESLIAGNDSSLEIHKTDTTTILIDSESYETSVLTLDGMSAVPTAIMRQLTKAMLHKQVYIDGIQYVSNSVPENEGIPYTNQHKMTFNLTKTGSVFNSEFSGIESSISGVELIGLLQDGNNYIKVQ